MAAARCSEIAAMSVPFNINILHFSGETVKKYADFAVTWGHGSREQHRIYDISQATTSVSRVKFDPNLIINARNKSYKQQKQNSNRMTLRGLSTPL
jgi:hypothetical protein